MRAITASEDVASLIDKGADIDSQIKSLTSEDKGIKSKLTESLCREIPDDENSVRAMGKKAAAVVSSTERVAIITGAEQFPELRKALDSGLLSDVVVVTKSLSISPDVLEKAADVLRERGFPVVTVENFDVKAADIRAMKKKALSSQHARALKVLEDCLSRDVSYRIKYEKRGKDNG